jgi:hypothetical protein
LFASVTAVLECRVWIPARVLSISVSQTVKELL